ncbi:MAG: Bug family tripartite tricarboxylate transporter substrate binding protein [Xanthobacteraceae bacterium]
MARPALAQQWPAQDIHFVTGTAAGSGGDVIVRYFAEKLRPVTGRAIIVENRVGFFGNIAIEYVARSKPDGYTILLWGGSNIASMMSVLKNPPIDVAKALQVAATINRQAFMFVVDAKTPYHTLDDLTKAMLVKGDKASYATSNNEATIMGEMYKAKTGVTTVEVPYKTAADSINDIFSGAVDYAIHNPVLALAQRNQGKMRILGVGANERFKAVPEIPTMTEQGVPMNVIGWWAATVPAGTPRNIVNQINKWFVDVENTDETKKFLSNLGGDPLIKTPDEAQAMLLADVDNWRDYVRIAKITPQG